MANLQTGQERLGLWAIAILPRCWMDSQRQADRIDDLEENSSANGIL
ncbi:hypothetical protein V473_07435 [Sphingobium cupriresistens LL01]|uniref:Uncharacterized protein n=1 Tax=Sphingobium cupriresistens LL01 TaxID=1420583 RepID=A0A0J7Y542_9SPHN|nr:hypothetical protein V473_07435 [Sphingobium cupriresistens LL01]